MKKNKIPGSIIAFLVLLIVFVIILVALVVPTITGLPKYNEDHAAISAQIADCDSVLADQTNVEKRIEQMTQQYDENQEALYIDAKSSVEDLQSIFADLGIDMASLNRGESIQDDKGRTSKGGVPLLKQIFLSATTAQKRTHLNLFITLNRNQRVVTLLIHS